MPRRLSLSLLLLIGLLSIAPVAGARSRHVEARHARRCAHTKRTRSRRDRCLSHTHTPASVGTKTTTAPRTTAPTTTTTTTTAPPTTSVPTVPVAPPATTATSPPTTTTPTTPSGTTTGTTSPPAFTLPAPQYVANPGASAPDIGTPLWMQQAYDLTALSADAGQGQTVAVFNVGADSSLESELATYRSTYGLPACTTMNGCFTTINPSGTSEPQIDSGWAAEADLDVDAISAVCPLCHIMFVQDQTSALIQDAQVARADGATVFSISATWGSTNMPDPATILPTVESTGDDGPGQAVTTPNGDADVTSAGGTSLVQDIRTPRGYVEDTWSGAGASCLTTVATPSWQQGLDTGCSGRAYADVSADADPYTGLDIFTSQGWAEGGGTSLSAPIIASVYALLQSQGVDDFSTPAWAYGGDASAINQITEDFPASGTYAYLSNTSTEYTQPWTISSSSYCTANPTVALCAAQHGWSGPAGMGSISGDLTQGAPGIGSNGYVASTGDGGMTIDGGAYTNGEPTRVYLQYGATRSYGYVTDPVTLDPADGASPVSFTVPSDYVTALGLVHYRLVAVNADGTTYGYDEYDG